MDLLFSNQHQTGFFLMELDHPLDPKIRPAHEEQVRYLLQELKLTRANKSFAAQYQARVSDLIGLNPAFFFRKDPEHGFQVISGILNNEQLQVVTHENNLDGEEVMIQGEYFFLRNSDGLVTGCFGIQSDVTEKVRQQQSMDIQKQLQGIAEDMTLTASFEWKPEYEKPLISKGMYRIIGLDPHAPFSWETIYKAVEKSERGDFIQLVKRLQKGEIRKEFETRFKVLHREGKPKYVWSKVTPVFDSNNRLQKVSGAVQDVSVQIRRELLTDILYNISHAAIELHDFNTFYKTIQKEISRLVDADNMFVAFYLPDSDQLDIQYVTGESDRFKLLPAEGTISKLVITENCSLLLNNETLLDLDQRGKIKRIGKNSKTWLGVPLRHGNEAFGVLVVQNYERSDALDAEDQALLEFISIQLVSAIRRMQDGEQIKVLRNSIQQSPVSVVITNREGLIEYVNPKFEEVTGYLMEEAVGRNPNILKSNIHPPHFYKEMWDTILSGQPWTGEMQNRRKSGELYWEQVSISPVKDDDDRITHFVALKEDITERKILEKDLFVAKEKAEESDRLKTAFLANMSHEIRTPMNGILGFSELLRDDDLSAEEFERYIEIINSNGNQLLSIIDDIITVSNLEIKQLRLNQYDFDLGSMLRNVKMTMEIEKRHMGKNHLKLDFPDQLACTTWIRGDQGKIQQILVNLLKNAIKFTHTGQVAVSCSELPGQVMEFAVRDTGIGIPEDMLEIIFDRFRQVDDSNTRSFGGTGLGLAISRGLAELLGGSIRVESKLHQGSVFTFTFPFTTPNAHPS